MQALVYENDFVHFEQCAAIFGPYIDLNAHLPLLTSIIHLLEWFVEPCYRFLSPSVFSQKTPDLINISSLPGTGTLASLSAPRAHQARRLGQLQPEAHLLESGQRAEVPRVHALAAESV